MDFEIKTQIKACRPSPTDSKDISSPGPVSAVSTSSSRANNKKLSSSSKAETTKPKLVIVNKEKSYFHGSTFLSTPEPDTKTKTLNSLVSRKKTDDTSTADKKAAEKADKISLFRDSDLNFDDLDEGIFMQRPQKVKKTNAESSSDKTTKKTEKLLEQRRKKKLSEAGDSDREDRSHKRKRLQENSGDIQSSCQLENHSKKSNSIVISDEDSVEAT